MTRIRTGARDKLYQEARAIVTAELANITYTEFLPKLVGDRIDPYTGYQREGRRDDLGRVRRRRLPLRALDRLWGHRAH